MRKNEIWSRLLFPVFKQSQWDHLNCLVEKSSEFEFTPETKLDILSKALLFDQENFSGAKIMIDNSNYFEDIRGHFGKTIFFNQKVLENKALVDFLVNNGNAEDINSVDDDGNTPLTFAIKKHHEIPGVDIDTYC